MERKLTSACHPQTNSQRKRFNRTFVDMLKKTSDSLCIQLRAPKLSQSYCASKLYNLTLVSVINVAICTTWTSIIWSYSFFILSQGSVSHALIFCIQAFEATHSTRHCRTGWTAASCCVSLINDLCIALPRHRRGSLHLVYFLICTKKYSRTQLSYKPSSMYNCCIRSTSNTSRSTSFPFQKLE